MSFLLIITLSDSPKFDGVAPGMRTISVRDKIGCGVAVIEVGVIGYYKYFSPNNDGINDTWKVLGLNTTFNKFYLKYISMTGMVGFLR